MVLQDVENSASDSFSDNPYADSTDPYASSSPLPSGHRFDATSLPQPLPIIGTLMGFSATAVRYKTETTLKFAERKLGRQLNGSEAQALAFHIYQLEQTKSYFAATGAAAGAYRAYQTMAKNKYPFYQPKPEDINPLKFGPFKGPMAPFARHAWRFSLYLLVAGQMGSIIGQLIAQPMAAVNTGNDPKLEQFGNELKAASAVEQTRQSAQGRDIAERKREFERQTRDRQGMGPSPQANWGKRQQGASGGDDDVSPTAGNETWESGPSREESWDSLSSRGQDSARTGQQRGARLNSSSPFDDDASPTGGLFADEVSSSSSASQSRTSQSSSAQQQSRLGESAWDRLRRGGSPPAPAPGSKPSSQQPPRSEQREGSTLGDSFTFVEGDEERKRERDSAQREFDERIERERQGRDFSSGDGGRRW